MQGLGDFLDMSGVSAAFSWSTLMGWPWPPPVQDDTRCPRPLFVQLADQAGKTAQRRILQDIAENALCAAFGPLQQRAFDRARHIIEQTHHNLQKLCR